MLIKFVFINETVKNANISFLFLQFSEWTDHDRDIPDIGKFNF